MAKTYNAGRSPPLACHRGLRAAPRRGEFVFAKPNGMPYISLRGFMTACRRAGLTDVTPSYPSPYIRHPVV